MSEGFISTILEPFLSHLLPFYLLDKIPGAVFYFLVLHAKQAINWLRARNSAVHIRQYNLCVHCLCSITYCSEKADKSYVQNFSRKLDFQLINFEMILLLSNLPYWHSLCVISEISIENAIFTFFHLWKKSDEKWAGRMIVCC